MNYSRPSLGRRPISGDLQVGSLNRFRTLHGLATKRDRKLSPRHTRLSDFDKQVLLFLLDQRFATLNQIHFAFFRDKSLSTARSYLTALSASGLLRWHQNHVSRPWSVSELAVTSLISQLDDENHRRLVSQMVVSPETVSITTNHDLLLTDVRVVLMNYFETRFLRWFPKREIKRMFSEFGDVFEHGNGFLWPDAVLRYLDNDGITCHFWIHLDRREKKSSYYFEHFKQNLFPPDDARFALNNVFIHLNKFLYVLGPKFGKLSLPLNGRKHILKSYQDDYADMLFDEPYLNLISEYRELIEPGDDDDWMMDNTERFYHLPLLFEPELERIKIMTWDEVKRPRNEVVLYRSNERFRELMDLYDPCNSFLQSYGKGLSFDWMKKALYQ